MANGKSPAPRPHGSSSPRTGRGGSIAGEKARSYGSRKRTNAYREDREEREIVGIDDLSDVIKKEKEDGNMLLLEEEDDSRRVEVTNPASFSSDNKHNDNHREPMVFSSEEVQEIKILFRKMSNFVKTLAQISSDNVASPILKEIANEGAVKRLKEYEKEIARKIFMKTLIEIQADKKAMTIEILYENKMARDAIKEQLDEDDINIKNPEKRRTKHILSDMKEIPLSDTQIRNKMFEEPTILHPTIEILRDSISRRDGGVFDQITKELEEFPFFSEDVLSTF